MLHSLNENIKRLRISQGMSQVEFASLVGVTKQCVSNWENDNVLPSVEMLIRIAEAFFVTTDELLGLEHKVVVFADGLTDEQLCHIRAIVKEFQALQNKDK